MCQGICLLASVQENIACDSDLAGIIDVKYVYILFLYIPHNEQSKCESHLIHIKLRLM